jgi:hypothetical protein
MGRTALGVTPMERSLKLANQVSRPKPSLEHWGFAGQAAMALIVIVLFTLTSAALETFLSGYESLSDLQAVIATR